MLDGEISKYVDIFYKELHRDLRFPLICSRRMLNDLIVAVEAARQGSHGAGRYSVGTNVCG